MNDATLTYILVHMKQPLSLAKYLKFKSMHVNTHLHDQLLFQHCSVGTTKIIGPI